MEKIERPNIDTRLGRDYFSGNPEVVASFLLGRTVVRQFPNREILAKIKEVAAWQGEDDSSSETIKYDSGLIGISKKYGKNIIDIATGSAKKPSCISLIALVTPKGIVQGPGNVSEYLEVNDMFNYAPIDHPCLWIGGEEIDGDKILRREKSNLPRNCKGYFYYR